MISKKQVEHIAKLARLRLTTSEIEKYQQQLGEILNYVGQLKKAKTDKVAPCTGGTDLKNVFRQDKTELRDSKERQSLLDQAPKRKKDLIKTKGVFYEPR